MSNLRERLIGALNADPGVFMTSVDGTERYVQARTSVVADAVIRFFAARGQSEDPMLEEVRGWYIDGRRVHNPFASDAELVQRFDQWLAEHDAELLSRSAPVPDEGPTPGPIDGLTDDEADAFFDALHDDWRQPVLEHLAPRLSWWAGRVTDAAVDPLTEEETVTLHALLLDARNAAHGPDEETVTSEPEVTWPGDLRESSRVRSSRELIREANSIRDLDGTGIVGRLADMLAGWLRAHAEDTGTPVAELDVARRLLWIIVNRHVGGVPVSDAEMVTVPRLPAIEVTYDPGTGITLIHACPTPEGSET